MSASGAFVSQQPPRQLRAGVRSHVCGSRCVSPRCAGPDALLRPSRAPRRTRAKDACGDTSAECYVRQRQAAKAGVDACVCCDTKCCAWASAHVTWLRGEGSAASLDASEASFRAAVEVRWLCLVSARHIFVPTALTPRLRPLHRPRLTPTMPLRLLPTPSSYMTSEATSSSRQSCSSRRRSWPPWTLMSLRRGHFSPCSMNEACAFIF